VGVSVLTPTRGGPRPSVRVVPIESMLTASWLGSVHRIGLTSIILGSRMEQPHAPISLPVQPIVGRARGQLASPVDGRYGPMDPDDLRPAIARLARELDLEGVKFALGIPEGGYIPAYAFAVETGLRVVLASIWQPNVPGVVSFTEDHNPSPARGKHFHGLSPGDHVIVVEDEVTSGRTIVNCVRALRAAGVRCDQVATIYAADDPAMRARVAAEGIRLHAASLCQADTNEQLYRP
jgi:adenine phosphoribosyltransferase